MRRFIKAITPLFSLNQDQQAESKKISYWLEKLFNQASPPAKIFSDTKTETPEEKGVAEAIKNHANKAEKNRQALVDMVSNSNRILLKISSVFPWDLFPSSIIAEETRITVIHRQLFSSQVHSVDVKDISNVFVDTGILFAQLTLVSNTFAENQIIINRLWKEEAILMRRIIEGLRMFVNKDIDTTSYTVEDLVNKLKELSSTGIIL